MILNVTYLTLRPSLTIKWFPVPRPQPHLVSLATPLNSRWVWGSGFGVVFRFLHVHACKKLLNCMLANSSRIIIITNNTISACPHGLMANIIRGRATKYVTSHAWPITLGMRIR